MRIYVKVIPKASEIKVEKLSEGEYRVRLTKVPSGGEANGQLIRVLSGHFGVSKSQVEIAGGKTARTKIVDILK